MARVPNTINLCRYVCYVVPKRPHSLLCTTKRMLLVRRCMLTLPIFCHSKTMWLRRSSSSGKQQRVVNDGCGVSSVLSCPILPSLSSLSSLFAHLYSIQHCIATFPFFPCTFARQLPRMLTSPVFSREFHPPPPNM